MNNMPPLNPQVIENIRKQQEQMDQFTKELKRKENEVLKKLFRGKIKQNFLIEMKERILNRPDMMDIMVNHYDALDFSQEAIMRGKESLELDICKFITMYHFFNTLTLDDAKRASYHDDQDYIQKLSNQVVEAIKLRKVALMYNSKDSLESYYPLTYSTLALTNFLNLKFDEAMKSRKYPKIKNAIFRSQMQYKMLHKIKAVLVLIDNNLIEEAFNPLRSLFEIYMVYLSLDGCDEKVIERYCKYVEYQFDYQIDNNIPKEIEEAYYKLKNNGSQISRTDYLNFGWLDSILEYNYIDIKERKYKLVDVAEFLNMKYSSKIGTILYKCFRECSPLSHGFTGFLDYYTCKQSLSERLCYILKLLSDDMSKSYGFNLELSNVDLYKYLDNFYNQQMAYDKVIANDKKLYESLNKHYVNRIR